jgi:hypothetical protein
MVVQRYDATNNLVQTIGVPISYAPKEKWLARMSMDPNLNRPIAAQFPAISFEIIDFQYDGERRLSSVQRQDFPTGGFQYAPVPWNISFNLYLFVRNADDGAQLLEQILPFFGPEWTNKIILVPGGNSYNIPTILNGVTTEDLYGGDFLTRRSLVYTLNFTMKAMFFGPVNISGSRSKVIKKIQLDFGIPFSNSNMEISDYDVEHTARSERVIITPGLLANGAPTTNSAASISYSLISANSNYGIASNNFFFTDGLRYDPDTDTDL